MQALVTARFCETCRSRLDLEMASGFCPACLIDTALADEAAPQAFGTRIDDFEILDEVARGGMGIVYRARQHLPSRIVALKMILPAHINSPEAVSRFRAEAEAAASLDHEGILPIYAVGEKDGAPFYSMKFAEGGSLSAWLAEFQNKPRASAMLVAALARAVEHAHQHGILHRDLKPGNVLFDGAGKAFVSDFGLAKWLEREADLTQTLAILGTPYYMAPEQAAGGHSLTPAADIYSLGAILFHLLTGEPPFRGETPVKVLRNAAEQCPRRPRSLNRHIPKDLETICLKCLEKKPAARYLSAGALADDLDRFLSGHPVRAQRAGPAKRALRWTVRNPLIAGLTAASLCLFASLLFVTRSPAPKILAAAAPAQPSVAVLPFDDSGDDKANAYFASGIHDDILVELSKLSALKVISRNSVMQYRGVSRDLREIGRALGVNAVLEGSVRREHNRARIDVQLIKAADGAQIWAENYEREISDAFAIESDVALRVASALKANLSSLETARLQVAPTRNGEAYLRFIEAKNLYQDYRKLQPDLDKAEQLYREAITLDPAFALAYARLSELENVYHVMYDATAERREKARRAAHEALRLQPDLPEAHMALGLDYWRVNLGTDDFDYSKALAEFAIAQRGLPNDAQLHGYIGRVNRHRGKWAESTAQLKKAASLDPNSVEPWHRLFYNYELTKNYADAWEALDHATALAPASSRWRYAEHRAYLHMYWKGELTEMERLPPPPNDQGEELHSEEMWGVEIFLRNFDEAERILLNDSRDTLSYGSLAAAPKSLILGRTYFYGNDQAKAETAFNAARWRLEDLIRAQPHNPQLRMLLAEAYARLGHKAEAIAEAENAAETLPESKDAYIGVGLQCSLAETYIMVGDLDRALPIIAHCLDIPGGYFANGLKLDPFWDVVHGDPRFQAIIARAEKATKVE
jgi:serine/threonine protein kinase/Flp pilus assembly protein TadD